MWWHLTKNDETKQQPKGKKNSKHKSNFKNHKFRGKNPRIAYRLDQVRLFFIELNKKLFLAQYSADTD